MKAVIITPKLSLPAYAGSDVHFYELSLALSEIGWEVELWTSDASNLEAMGPFDLRWKTMELPCQGTSSLPFLIDRIPLDRELDPKRHEVNKLSGYFDASTPLAGDDLGLDWLMNSTDRPSYSEQVFMLNGNGPSWGALYKKMIGCSDGIDVIICGYFPFASMSYVVAYAELLGIPCFGWALFHPRDMGHYLTPLFDSLRGCTGIICSTKFEERIFSKLNRNCIVTGVGLKSANWDDSVAPGEGLEIVESMLSAKRERKLVLLFVGRKEASKNYSLLLRLASDFKDCIELYLVGSDSDGKPINQCNVQHFSGLGDNQLKQAYENADILVFPSLHESFGLVVIESWAVGRPVIVSKYNEATTSIVTDEVDGFTCGSYDNWKMRIDEILSGKWDLCAMGSRGKEKVESTYNWRVIAESIQKYTEQFL